MLTALTSIIIAIISGSGAWYATFVARKKDRQEFDLKIEEFKAKNQELAQEKTALELVGFRVSLETANEINEIVDYLFKHTKVDRFLILLAANGKFPPRFVTVNFERHKESPKMTLSIGASDKYIRFEYDSYYRDMLIRVEDLGVIKYSRNAMPESDYRNIMENEKLEHSNVYFLSRKVIDEANHLIAFASTATHSVEPFKKNEDFILKSQVDKLKAIFAKL